ncbi:MAG: site-specific DNA-methyltransferase [Campylobacteraceae bacterium]|jgi:adenine-specific DNA-methyltransferase|nr:site-specific DNA-methyltransferase [Campylobacteraceae bacterium]
MKKEEFEKAGFNIMENKTEENTLVNFLKQNYPSVIKDGEIKLDELKNVIGLPFDEKLNGYGLNFIGRQVAKAKAESKTEKYLKINEKLSKDFDTTQNIVLKGDNLDCLKILKNYYRSQIKCIYIDPPYNTDSEQFIYPDRFDKEEQEALGLADISESDLERLEFSFKSPKSHNGWLTFMYPRLKLARELLSDDGVIFISIDDNEQANLKLLCDDIFGEENFVVNMIWEKVRIRKNSAIYFTSNHDFIMCYAKKARQSIGDIGWERNLLERENGQYKNLDNDPNGPWMRGSLIANHFYDADYTITKPNGVVLRRPKNGFWRYSKESIDEFIKTNRILWGEGDSCPMVKKYEKDAQNGLVPKTIITFNEVGGNPHAAEETKQLFNGIKIFDNPKPASLIEYLLKIGSNQNDLILDFFAGSGTTAHAVMQLNAKDGGNRKFILCQIDEPIKADKPAYQFCKDNNLEPLISSITIERLNRAGDKIKSEIGLTAVDLDIGYKVFDLTQSPHLEFKNSDIIEVINEKLTPLDRIYNLIFNVGLDNPTTAPKELLKDCMYLCETTSVKNYYVTNSRELDKKENSELLRQAIGNGKVYIDGWTASINTTLQTYKDDIKIIF